MAPYCLAKCFKAMGRTAEAITVLQDGLDKCASPDLAKDYRKMLAELLGGGE